VVVWICSVVMKAAAAVETTNKKRNTLLDSAMLGLLHSSCRNVPCSNGTWFRFCAVHDLASYAM
jgi:hypothetical protein